MCAFWQKSLNQIRMHFDILTRPILFTMLLFFLMRNRYECFMQTEDMEKFSIFFCFIHMNIQFCSIQKQANQIHLKELNDFGHFKNFEANTFFSLAITFLVKSIQKIYFLALYKRITTHHRLRIKNRRINEV